MQHFFPHDATKVTDRLFKFLPNEVRGPVLTSWGLRGAKSALKDTDEKVQSVVWDALLAGDIDHEAFEQAILCDVARHAGRRSATGGRSGARGKLSKLAIHKALDTAYELGALRREVVFRHDRGAGREAQGDRRRERRAHEGRADRVGAEDSRLGRRVAEGAARDDRVGPRSSARRRTTSSSRCSMRSRRRCSSSPPPAPAATTSAPRYRRRRRPTPSARSLTSDRARASRLCRSSPGGSRRSARS